MANRRALISALLSILSADCAAAGPARAPDSTPSPPALPAEPSLPPPQEFNLWSEAPPLPPPPGLPEELWQPDKAVRGNEPLRTVQFVRTPTLTVWRPPAGRGNGAALVLCPGGGYRTVVQDREGNRPARVFARAGITVFVLKYRHYSPEAAAADGYRAMRVVRARAAEFGVDPHAVGMGGFSAGGRLTFDVVVRAKPEPGVLGDDMDEQATRPDFLLMVYPGGVDQFPPGFKLDATFPPVFLIGSTPDNPMNRVIPFYEALARAGARVEAHIFQHGKHGFDLGEGLPTAPTWPKIFIDWLAANRAETAAAASSGKPAAKGTP